MSEKITFKELVELIAEQAKQSQSSANSFIHELVEIIESGLKQSGSVSISGFGKFELRWMKERSGVNPQTGEEITVPGQNKVVFKPYKALRETVNTPFAGLEPEILKEASESSESESEQETEPDSAPEESEDEFKSTSEDSSETINQTFEDFEAPPPTPSFEESESDPFGFGESEPFDFDEPDSDFSKEPETVDDLIIERENPRFKREEQDVAVLSREEPEEEEQEKIAPVLPDESKHAKEVQKSGSMRWSYAAAVIVVMIAFIVLFYMMQRGGESVEETTTPDQTEQVVPATPSDEETESTQESTAETEETVSEEQPSDQPAEPPPQDEIGTESYSVQPGQSLWEIAESELGNPYLWPAIYEMNQDLLDNPNQLLADADIAIPSFSDPDNLTEPEREQVARGYFSLYQWSRENNPDEARYFLWAVGVFSQDLLDQPPAEVDSTDLEFARNR